METTEALQLSDEELKLLEQYRAGKFHAVSDRVVSEEDLSVLNEADTKIKTLLYEVGILEERKSYILSALESARQGKNAVLQEVMLKYGIPANQPFKINRDTGVVDFELNPQDLNNLE